MKDGVTKKTSLHKKLLLFMNLDIWEQIWILIKIFAPLLILGVILQNKDFTSAIFGAFVVIVIGLAMPAEPIEIVSSEEDLSIKSQCIRLFKMLINVALGIIYFGAATFGAAMLLHHGGQIIGLDGDKLFCFDVAGGVILFALIVWLILWKYKHRLFLRLSDTILKNRYTFNVENEDFLQIETKQKCIEFRLADSKRKRIKVGDILVFQNMDDLKKYVTAEVTKLYSARNFAELMPQIDVLKTGYGNADDVLSVLNHNYTAKQQEKKKVIGIEFKCMN